MADTVLLFGTHLADCAPLLRHVEDWIVAEATCTARLLCDQAFERALYLANQAAWSRSGNHDRAAVTRRTLLGRHALESGEKSVEALRIRDVFAGPARGVNAWLATQRINLESRVVR